jgi:hypothetical protein
MSQRIQDRLNDAVEVLINLLRLRKPRIPPDLEALLIHMMVAQENWAKPEDPLKGVDLEHVNAKIAAREKAIVALCQYGGEHLKRFFWRTWPRASNMSSEVASALAELMDARFEYIAFWDKGATSA